MKKNFAEVLLEVKFKVWPKPVNDHFIFLLLKGLINYVLLQTHLQPDCCHEF